MEGNRICNNCNLLLFLEAYILQEIIDPFHNKENSDKLKKLKVIRQAIFFTTIKLSRHILEGNGVVCKISLKTYARLEWITYFYIVIKQCDLLRILQQSVSNSMRLKILLQVLKMPCILLKNNKI